MVFGLAGVAMHHGALGIMRSAGRLGIPVSLVRTGSASPIERSRYNGDTVVLPDGADAGLTLEVLRERAVQLERPLLVAVDDASAMFVDDHGEVLHDLFRLPSQPAGLARALADKRSMHELCVRHAVATPSVAFPSCEADVRAHGAHARFPIVAKRIDASQPVMPGTPNVLVARDPDELLAAYAVLESTLTPNVMFQEYVPDTPGSNWMFNGYFDRQARCTVACTGRKLRQSPPDAGATTLGVCEASPALAQTTRAFMAALGYRGIVDIDYRFDCRDGQFKLLDVNPRIGSSFRLFAADDGADVLRALYFDLTGTPRIHNAAPRTGRRWVVEPQDLRSSIAHVKRRDLTFGQWLRSLRHVREAAWWARDDPLPCFAVIASLLAARLRKLLANGRSATPKSLRSIQASGTNAR